MAAIKYARVKCEVCGDEFSTSHIYNHKRAMHGIMGGRTGKPRGAGLAEMRTRKTPCPICGHELGRNNMTRHIKVHHGNMTLSQTAAVIERTPVSNGKLTFHAVENFILLEASDNTLWLAEKIR